jgi:hypothetical protein
MLSVLIELGGAMGGSPRSLRYLDDHKTSGKCIIKSGMQVVDKIEFLWISGRQLHARVRQAGT